jgi:hypothetical protein
MGELKRIQEVFKLRKRNHRRQDWIHWLKRFWKALIKKIRSFFTDDLDKEKSPRHQEFNQNLDQTDYSNGNSPIAVPRPKPFLLGLENMPNLEFLTTNEFLAEIEWNVQSQVILPVKDEDLTLLDDLLMNFPDA